MKKKYAYVIAAIMLVISLLLPSTVCASTHSGSCGKNLKWYLDDSGTLTISGTGTMNEFETITDVPWHNYSESIKNIHIENGVTNIEKYAFYNCVNLTTAEIAESVSSISDWVFSNCTNLTYVNLPAGLTSISNYLFYFCTNLPSINIPSKVKSIGDCAFERCIQIKSIDIPKSVTTIGYSSFRDCINLSSVTMQSDSVTTLGYMSFYNCIGLTSITLPGSIEEIGGYAFLDCENLESVNIPESTKIIDSGAFENCNKITSIIIPENVDTIRYSAFKACTNLVSVTMLGGVLHIGNKVFDQCVNLKYVTLPNSLITIGNSAFPFNTAITHVYFTGSENEWNKIKFGNHNIALFNAEKHYNSNPFYPIDNNNIMSKSNVVINEHSITVNTNLDMLDDTQKQMSEVHIVLYDENDIIIDSYSAEYTGNDINTVLNNVANADHIRVFVWSNDGNMIPITDVAEYISL